MLVWKIAPISPSMVHMLGRAGRAGESWSRAYYARAQRQERQASFQVGGSKGQFSSTRPSQPCLFVDSGSSSCSKVWLVGGGAFRGTASPRPHQVIDKFLGTLRKVAPQCGSIIDEGKPAGQCVAYQDPGDARVGREIARISSHQGGVSR